jgi:hypothetical protein
MSATIQLPPGTHHLKFIVDGDMMISTDLPTAVDYTNVLVNYLEVNADEIPPPKPARRESDRTKSYPAHPPLAPPPEDDDSGTETEMDRDSGEEEIPLGDFRQIIPQALIDMELPDEDPKYQNAANIISDCPGPPSMPLFLGKSVLNGQLPLKDDSSVLPLPNHTVLNHLATSSLKNGVLATSVTTRYMKKVRGYLISLLELMLMCGSTLRRSCIGQFDHRHRLMPCELCVRCCLSRDSSTIC